MVLVGLPIIRETITITAEAKSGYLYVTCSIAPLLPVLRTGIGIFTN